jgi:glycosyltransferase involved in cell wall biosynthesis/Tfp pilus assembly protein PilF
MNPSTNVFPEPVVPGTLLVIAPFHNRSGYGVLARTLAATLHGAGVQVKCVSVDNVEEGIDDCDSALLHRLEKAPLSAPVNALFIHVPSEQWLKVQLPPGSKRILATTFDSSAQKNAPPEEWIRVCRAMDQVWLGTDEEAEIFARSGLPKSKIRVIRYAHHWIDNPILPAVQPVPLFDSGKGRFRFLSIAMLQPRRRWDALIEAFLGEFRGGEPVELYLKVNYPSWHPVRGQPQRDLQQMIERARRSTGSEASIIVDETLGTRLDICRLIDSCQVYASTDTCGTAPTGESMVRERPVITPEGLGLALSVSDIIFPIRVDPTYQRPMTEAELLYQPHHRGRSMPLLHVEDVRSALRAAFQAPIEQLRKMGKESARVMHDLNGPTRVVPMQIATLRELRPSSTTSTSKALSVECNMPTASPVSVAWMGSFLDYGSLSFVNRELTRHLERQPALRLIRGPKAPLREDLRSISELNELWKGLQSHPAPDTAIFVRHNWPPNWQAPRSGALVVMQPWEFGSLPEEWVRQSSRVAEFWAYSKYVREVYVASGVPPEKVKIVPLGIDPERFHAGASPIKLATTKRFKFLFVGGTIHRKGPDVMLKAYLEGFNSKDDVCLVIKDFGGRSVYAGQTLEDQIKAAQAQPGAPEILYLNEELAPEALPGLYTACDCLVHPYRGEGFGLPILEAMACGLPVIVTAGGAADDFATEEVAYRIPSVRKIFGDHVGNLKLAGPGWLLEPDCAALQARMKWVAQHPDEAHAKGCLATEHARQHWTWEHSAQVAAERLQQIASSVSCSKDPARTKQAASPAVLPSVAHIGNLVVAREYLAHKRPADAWSAALEAIEKRPFHPEAFLFLAETALALGDPASARLCAEEARCLAPGWKPARQFLNRRLAPSNRTTRLQLPAAVAPGVSRQAPRLSVCLIAKNEEKFLGQCLASIKPVAHQIVLVDTGSKDRTLEIAKSFGAEVHHFEWCEDFSAARNVALEHARGDWVLILDADEELPVAEHDRLKCDMEQSKVIAYRLPMVSGDHPAGGRIFVPRLFRNAPGVHFYGRIHEQVFPSLTGLVKAWGLEGRLGTAQMVHHGYTAEVVKSRNKIERNLALLRREIQDRPHDPNIVMNLGLELVRSGEFDQGLNHYREAYRLMSAQAPSDVAPEMREVLLTQLSCYLRQAHAHGEIIEVLTSGLAKNGGLTASMHFALGLAHFELKQFAQAAAQMRHCLAKIDHPVLSPINQDIQTALPHHCLAISLARQGDVQGAEQAFQTGMSATKRVDDLKLDYARLLHDQKRSVEALQLLHEIISEHPTHAGSWRLGGLVALSHPDFLEVARDWTNEAATQLPEDKEIMAQRAEALMLSQEVATARSLWERLWTGEKDVKSLAAMILCDLTMGASPVCFDECDSVAVSRAFIFWYRKCLSLGIRELVEAVNGRTNDLRSVLPEAALVVETALAQASQAPKEEPCLA